MTEIKKNISINNKTLFIRSNSHTQTARGERHFIVSLVQ